MQRSMMQVFIKNSDKAIPFYQNVFGVEAAIYGLHSDGTVIHAEFDIFGQAFAICETLENETLTGNIMQFCLHFGEGKEEIVRGIIDKLSDGALSAQIIPVDFSPLLADITDKFGMRWCIFI